MYSDKVFYRPPIEANSILLEVGTGCSYGKCIFCRCSAGVDEFSIVANELIEENLKKIEMVGTRGERIFLLGGNILALKTEYLIYLFSLIHEYLPTIGRISMYARADDVNNKTLDQLIELRKLGMDTLYIGVESGSDQILRFANKGIDVKSMLTAFYTLDLLGIPYGISCIIGLGGENSYEKAAKATSRFINKINPESIRLMKLTPIKNTHLDNLIRNGEFCLQDRYESLQEEILLLEGLRIEQNRCLFVANHISNDVPVVGILPNDKEKILKALKSELSHYQNSELDQDSIGLTDKW